MISMRKHVLLVLSFLMVPLGGNVSTVSDAAEEWTILPPMPTARTEVTAATVGSSIYVVGGFDVEGNTVDTVEVYDARSDTWSRAKELPIPLHHAAAASYQGKLYVVGGYLSGWIPSNTLFIYDPFTNDWRRASDMPTPRGALTAQFIDGIIYAVGGWNGLPLGTNESYNPSTDSWSIMVEMPTAREHLASGVVNGNLYVIGGRDGGLMGNLDVNEEYDPKANKWTAKASMPSKRGGVVGSSLSESIFVFGGESSATTFDNNEQYLAPYDIWIVRDSMPSARHGLAAAEVGGGIYVIGGGLKPGLSVSNNNEVFTPVDWRQVLDVDIRPQISIEPKTIGAHDKIHVTVSFETNTAGHIVKFGEVSVTEKIFTVDVTVIPPSTTTVVAPVVTKHSHTYTLEGLTSDHYTFVVLINGERVADSSIIVGTALLVIETPVDHVIELSTEQQLRFDRSVQNESENTQPFIYLLQVKDSAGVTVSLSWVEGELLPNGTNRISQSWIPEFSGRYVLELFVWDSMEQPNVLAPMHTVHIRVV
jgi:N-acetylneuraminic acid mutarotase